MELKQNKFQAFKFVDYDRNKHTIKDLCKIYNNVKGERITSTQIIKRVKIKEIAMLRHAIATVLFNQSNYYTYERVGKMLNRSHATIVHSVKLSTYDKEVIRIVDILENGIKNRKLLKPISNERN